MVPRLAALALLMAGLVWSAAAQGFVSKGDAPRVLKFSPDSVLLITEIATLVGHEEGVLKVLLAPPPSRELTGVQQVDLAEGDEVGMAGGSRIRTVGELKALYEAAAAGSEFKLGVRREGRPIVVIFSRKDPQEPGSGGIMTITAVDTEDQGAGLFPALGFRLADSTDGLTVAEVLPEGPFPVKEGDRILSLNGTPTATIEEFEEALGAVAPGQSMTLQAVREGKSRTFTAPRPDPRATILKVR